MLLLGYCSTFLAFAVYPSGYAKRGRSLLATLLQSSNISPYCEVEHSAISATYVSYSPSGASFGGGAEKEALLFSAITALVVATVHRPCRSKKLCRLPALQAWKGLFTEDMLCSYATGFCTV